MDQEDKKSRDYFRVEYPPDVQPVLQLEDGSFPVINLCEGGVKFAFNTKGYDLKTLQERTFNATIVFHNHDRSQIIGTVIRADKGYIVLKLSQGVSFQKIMAEQRFLLNKYGTLRRPTDS